MGPGLPKSRMAEMQNLEPGEVPRSVKCLLHKHQDLSLIPKNHVTKLDVVAGICDPGTGETERERIAVASWPGSLVESVSSLFNERPCLRK